MATAIVERSWPAIVFSRTRHGAERLSKQLNKAGVRSEAIHGDRSQSQRERALGAFGRGDVTVLVATDVAARGIDVTGVSHVVNYQCPEDDKTYVHRVGRTARAGASGVAVTFTVMSGGGSITGGNAVTEEEMMTNRPTPDRVDAATAAKMADSLLTLKSGLVTPDAYKPAGANLQMGKLAFSKLRGCVACHQSADARVNASGFHPVKSAESSTVRSRRPARSRAAAPRS